MADQLYNPIRLVDGAEVPCPSTYEYKLSDVSAAEAGRTEDGKMHKMRIAQKVHLELAWNYISTSEVSAILNAFDPEYIEVQFLDPKENGYSTKTFYVGDRSAPCYNAAMGLWTNVAFNIIEQ